MREIKFRAWHKNHRHFIKNWDLYLSLDGKVCAEGDCGSMRSPDPYFPWDVSEFVEINQFTGLKDKNGNEIYQGDMVKTYINSEKEEVVGEVVFDNDNTAFGIEIKGNFWRWLQLSDPDDIEIKGNIYEKNMG